VVDGSGGAHRCCCDAGDGDVDMSADILGDVVDLVVEEEATSQEWICEAVVAMVALWWECSPTALGSVHRVLYTRCRVHICPRSLR
jgi:hypothetical protein